MRHIPPRMIETNLNVFDIIVLSIMGLSCLFAFFRGLVREILSLVAWIGAGIITILYFPDMAKLLEPHFKNPAVAAGVGAIALYIGALVALGIVNMLIIKTIKGGSDGGMLDNLLGLLFGAFRGAFIVSLGFFLLTSALPERDPPKWLQDAVTRPYVEKGALLMARMVPEYSSEISALQKKAVDRLKARQIPASDDYERPEISENGNGYSRDSSRLVDRLLDRSHTQ